MKRLAYLFLFVAISTFASAQDLFSNEINKTLEIVIQHQQNHFAAIKGAAISQKGQTAEYRTTAQVPGAVSNNIIETRSNGKLQVKWNSILFRTNNFEQAKAKFNDYFQAINNGIIKSGTDKPFILSGTMKEASPNSSTSVYFQLLPSIGDMKDVMVELNMQKQGNAWRIGLNVYKN